MFFPEGTRSLDGSVGAFNDGPFYLARKAGVPILPIAVEGSHHCLPKHSWIFGEPAKVKLRLFSPVDTTGVTPDRIPQLRESVRSMIISQVDEWRIQGVG
jgi:1-acyl-sn-glycerol-3-phosphate acyltransferase